MPNNLKDTLLQRACEKDPAMKSKGGPVTTRFGYKGGDLAKKLADKVGK